ncbi:hypothetical protein KP79_PYT18764 [Mizuhopecten yessoensis]|uniref:Uncharacterized protein n=1 Tax=Mizuhopecten yessoensis TaxID=6573 RepID=A0A210Q3H0_MIZYE|nr:hypothetical protein KP79_PYT18764 [Mizuhopecten yessoensis]
MEKRTARSIGEQGTWRDLETGQATPLSDVINNSAISSVIGEIEKATIHKNTKHAVHSAVQDLEQQGIEWDYNVSYREGINPDVHMRIINTVMSQYPTMVLAGVVKACRSYFMTRKTRAKRIQTNKVEEARKKQRKRQRMTNNRIRRLTALSSITSGVCVSDRLKLEEALSTTTFISSQESDSDSDDRTWPKRLVVRKLAWRSDFLDHWFAKLDGDHLKSDRCLSRREAEEESRRLPPKDGPAWALQHSVLNKRR